MKNILSLFLVLLSGISFGCNKDEESPSEGTLKVVSGLTADNTLEVSALTTEAAFYVMTPLQPAVVSTVDWMSASASSPNNITGVSTITVKLTQNEDTLSDREGMLIISSGNNSLEIPVIQSKAITNDGPQPAPGGESPAHSPWLNPEPCEIGGDNAREVALSLGVGWNLGNQMDAFSNGFSSETAWGNPAATQALFDALKSHGFSTVRIPVTWLGHIGDAPEYKIDEAWLNRVVELVNMAERAGLNAIVNMHHDGADSKHWLDIKSAATNANKNEEIKREITALWTQIAEAMKDKGNFLMFEAFNEIHDGGWGWGGNRTDGGKQYQCLNEWNQAFVKAVRATGGNNATRWLSVPSYVTNIDLAVGGDMVIPFDQANRVMVSVHFYDPNDFALTSIVTDWGHTGDKSKKGSVVQDEDYIKSQFAKLTNYFVDKGIPVYIGEHGPSNQATARGKAFRNYYLEYMCRAAREAGLSTIYWDNGYVGTGTDKFGLFNHGSGDVINNSEETINAMILGGTCRDEDYNLDYIYENAPVF